MLYSILVFPQLILAKKRVLLKFAKYTTRQYVYFDLYMHLFVNGNREQNGEK